MNSSSLLIGTAGGLLVVALVLSITNMNKQSGQSSDELAELKQDLEEMRLARMELEKQKQSYLSPYSYLPSTPVEAPTTADPELESIKQRLAQAEERNNNLERDLRDLASQPAPPAPEPTPVVEEPEPAPTKSSSRPKLIEQAILQATVLGYDKEFGFVTLDPTPSANFSVGQELGIRRNNGVLCRLHVDRAGDGQYVASVKAVGDLPDIQVGDEVIIPPAFDGILD
ncbi:MAG: hypothetical protein Q7Q71_09350 [Verrucomicrobiota bacterium JB023]|nr:hypothetical protein [Verrucomicrobiota bacterium JB023]